MQNKQNEKKAKLSIAKGKTITTKLCSEGNIARLLIRAAENKNQKGIVFINNDESGVFFSYSEILDKAVIRLAALREKNFVKGQYVILLFVDNTEFIITFWACILGGMVPVPLSPPASVARTNCALDKIRFVWKLLGKKPILADELLVNVFKKGQDRCDLTVDIELINVSELNQHRSGANIRLGEPDQPAFIQAKTGNIFLTPLLNN